MAFYTAEWVRRLIKQDHKALQDHIKNKNNDFRSYIDSTLPFTLLLDIDIIKENVIKNSEAISELKTLMKLSSSDETIENELVKAYVKTINYYLDSYKKITQEELNIKLNKLKEITEVSFNIKNELQQLFKNTEVLSDAKGEYSVRGKRVLIISPKFTTIQSKFGSVVKNNFNYESFSDDIDFELGDSPKSIIKNYFKSNFGKLQNLGHVEIDVLSTVKDSTEVKRGLVTPRLLQALVEWPKESKIHSLVTKFSKETNQASTRIKVRKLFNTSKLTIEILIEAGMMIGTTESTSVNLSKAPLERAFLIGRNLTEKIRKDPKIIEDLETSKSLKGYLVELIINAYSKKPNKAYKSVTDIFEKTNIVREKVSVSATKDTSKKSTKSFQIRNSKGQFVTSSVNLQNLINSSLFEQIRQNMGSGSRKDVLNFRTGRLAESAKVERISQSRAGMITAFYSYMKNPYATFSEGGRQQYPKSRDPKLLISKSIREIASIQVANRLRAVAL